MLFKISRSLSIPQAPFDFFFQLPDPLFLRRGDMGFALHPAAVPLRVAVLQQMGQLVAVFRMDSQRQAAGCLFCLLHRPFTETDGKSNVGFRHRQSGSSLFLPALPADRGMAGVIILPDILPIPDIVRNNGVFLESHFHIQKSDLHQNASFRLPKSRARSVRFRAWWSASSRCSYRYAAVNITAVFPFWTDASSSSLSVRRISMHCRSAEAMIVSIKTSSSSSSTRRYFFIS